MRDPTCARFCASKYAPVKAQYLCKVPVLMHTIDRRDVFGMDTNFCNVTDDIDRDTGRWPIKKSMGKHRMLPNGTTMGIVVRVVPIIRGGRCTGFCMEEVLCQRCFGGGG